MGGLDRLEDVLIRHMYRYPICENIIRMNDSLTFEHEARLPNGNWLLIIYQYDSKGSLTVYRVFDRAELNDVTEEYKNHPNVVSVIRLIGEEVQNLRKAE